MIPKQLPINTVGQVYQNFKLVKITEIHELQSVLREFIHTPTQARVMHIANDDPENVFCLSFRTIPERSNGVAHILEHTVLCGSEKYPVKDPFFAMTRRSLNTFMNALTGQDFTCYPAASQVKKDFYNLLDVYIDAVFRPHLKQLSFLQEGHRLEFADPKNPLSPLEFKGIVYNEMKGSLSSPSTRMAEAISSTLYPNSTYGTNSGGDPKSIPDLTYEELVEFHRQYYHPSRCLFYFYGSFPIEEHLDFIANHILDQTSQAAELASIPPQVRFEESKKTIISYPVSREEQPYSQTMITFAWLTTHILDQETLLALSILEIILLETDASPLKRAFLDSGLCKQVSSYVDVETNEPPFVITLNGCTQDDANALQDILFTTLKEIIAKGIPLQQIEDAMHQLEFHRSEIGGEGYPFGLSLFMRAGLLKLHGANPEQGLVIHSLFENMRKRVLASPNYLTDILNKFTIENTHFIRIVMPPDAVLGEKELAEERLKLDKLQAALTEKEIQTILKQTEELYEFQRRQEEEVDVDILPKVYVKDVSPAARVLELNEEKRGNLTVYHHPCFTNKIVYADIAFNLPDIAEQDLPFVRLLTYLLPQMGCGGRSYMENLEYMQAHTGGVRSSVTFNMQAKNAEQFSPSFYLQGKALYHKAEKLFPLLNDVVTSADLTDKARLKELILKLYSYLQNSFNQNALKYAINLAASGLDVPSKISNIWYGLPYHWFIQGISRNFDSMANDLIAKLLELQEKILCTDQPDLILSCDAEMVDSLKCQEFYGLQHLLTHPYTPWKGDYHLEDVPFQGRIISAPVAFSGKVIKTVSYTHPDSPALNIAACLFDKLALHPLIREQGGAYGGGANSNPMAATFAFYSYRDPHIASSIKAFEIAVQEVLNGDFDENDVEEATLEMLQSIDAPIPPGQRADHAYGWLKEGKTLEVRQAYRDKLLSLTPADVISAVKKHIAPQMTKKNTVVFAGKALLEKENAFLAAHGEKFVIAPCFPDYS